MNTNGKIAPLIFYSVFLLLLSNSNIAYAEEGICDCPTDLNYVVEVDTIDSTTAMPLSFKDSTVYSCVPIQGREDCPIAQAECQEITSKNSQVSITGIRRESYWVFYDLSVATAFTCGDGTSCSVTFTTSHGTKDCSIYKSAWQIQKAKADQTCAEQLTPEMKDELCYIQKQSLTEAQNSLKSYEDALASIEGEISLAEWALGNMETDLAVYESELVDLKADTESAKAQMDAAKQKLDTAKEFEDALFLHALMRRGVAGFLGLVGGAINFVSDAIASLVTGASPFADARAAVVAAQHEYNVAKSAYDRTVFFEQDKATTIQSSKNSIAEKRAFIEQKNQEKTSMETSIDFARSLVQTKQAEYDACPSNFREACDEARSLEDRLKADYDTCLASVLV